MQQRRASAATWSPRNLLVGTSAVVAVLLLYSQALGSRTASLASDSDPAAVLAKSRRATLEAKWAQRRAHADAELRLAREQQQEAASPPEQAGALNLAAAEEPAAATAATAAAAAERVASGGSGCNVPPRPYHTILTSSSGGYQAWQCRVMHHHWKLQKARDPCGEMGGFTRLLTSPNELPDEYVDEIPTVVVKEARSAGYVVVNRPHSMVLFLQVPGLQPSRVPEPATLRARACSPTCQSLQPCVPEPAALRARACSPACQSLQPCVPEQPASLCAPPAASMRAPATVRVVPEPAPCLVRVRGRGRVRVSCALLVLHPAVAALRVARHRGVRVHSGDGPSDAATNA
jgi:hypothetical protein